MDAPILCTAGANESLFVFTGIETDCNAGQRDAVEVGIARAVAGEERAKAFRSPEVAQPFEIVAIVASGPRAKFVFERDHENGTAVLGQKGTRDFGGVFQIGGGTGDVVCVGQRAYPGVGILEQAVRDAAEIPLGADIRTGAQ